VADLPAVLEGLLLTATVALAVPVGVLVAQIVVASLGRRDRAPAPCPAEPRSSVGVLVPAHDEASGIAATLAALGAQLRSGDRLLVVADNCSDDTAALARGVGAEVTERRDPDRRGKGYALDWGVRHFESAPPAVVVVVDADCIVAPGAIDLVAQRSLATGRPVQALYLMRAPAGASLKSRIAEFAWVVKNEVRPLGSHRLGLPCQLAGSGMAFPWPVIRQAALASSHIVEDLQLGLELAIAGTPPLHCREALVTSDFPVASAGLASQRLRWEQGHLGVIARMGPRLLLRGLRTGRLELVAMALDLSVPPIAALIAALLALVVVSTAWALAGGPSAPMWWTVAELLFLGMALLAAWSRFGRHIVTFSELASAPGYVAAKLPMYARMAWRRQTEWVRTRRDDGGP